MDKLVKVHYFTFENIILLSNEIAYFLQFLQNNFETIYFGRNTVKSMEHIKKHPFDPGLCAQSSSGCL